MNSKAMIRWLPPDRGGRAAPPTGPYRTTARFEDARDRWPEAIWSLVVHSVHAFDDNPSATLCEVTFLTPDAPTELLSNGARFELCEGRRVVAKGVILPAQLDVPEQIGEFSLALLG